MAEPTNEDAAKALERLSNPQAPTPQPKPRPSPAAKPQPTKPQPFKPQPAAAKPGAAKSARPKAPSAKAPSPAKKPTPAPAPALPVNLQEALAGTRHAAPGLRTAPRSKSDPVAFQLALKRTAIPVLLTLGFILVSLGVVHFAWKSDDNPVLELPTGIVIGLFTAGAVLWALAALNMVSVRRTLATGREPR
jgi:hypothetical protein